MLLRIDLLDRNQSVSRLLSFALLLGMLVAAAPLHAQLKTTVHVDTAKMQSVIYTTSLGVAGDRWDGKAFDGATVRLLWDAGFTNLRFPGNNGIDALYHWSTGAIVNPYTNDRAPAFATERKFPAITPIIDQLGSALVTVNYGQTTVGTVSGPQAAAKAIRRSSTSFLSPASSVRCRRGTSRTRSRSSTSSRSVSA